MSGFFNYFPSVAYSNIAAKNILAKIQFEKSVAKNLAVFYPYTILEGERPDQIAASFYDDSNYDWIVYLCNNIIDPYHQWPKSDKVFNQHIITKYGSIANAQNQTVFYRTNYEFDDRVISVAAYNALVAAQKKFWTPNFSSSGSIINYQRSQSDLYTDTNLVLGLNGSFGNIKEGDLLRQNSAKGVVGFANSSYVIIKHVEGTWSEGGDVKIDNAVANVNITSVNTLQQPISNQEVEYFVPVSYFDYEAELNEQKKHIRLISSEYVDMIERDMKDLLQP